MLNQATLDKLHALKLTGMAAAYEKQLQEPEARGLSFEERFGMLVDSHWTWRENLALTRRLKKSKLSSEPCVEDINYRYPRQMDPATMRGLTNSQWVVKHLCVIFSGPTGIGKSWLAQALAQKACRDGYSVLYRSAAKLFRDLAEARADGSLGRLLDSIARTDVLLVDDFAMAPLNDGERRNFLEICDDRYGRRSTVLTSQLPVTRPRSSATRWIRNSSVKLTHRPTCQNFYPNTLAGQASSKHSIMTALLSQPNHRPRILFPFKPSRITFQMFIQIIGIVLSANLTTLYW